MNRCVFCNNEITDYHKTKKPTKEEIDNEHYFRNMNQEKFSTSEINFNDFLAHRNCTQNIRNWHKNNCRVFKPSKKCNCGCNIVKVKRNDVWCISENDRKEIKEAIQ